MRTLNSMIGSIPSYFMQLCMYDSRLLIIFRVITFKNDQDQKVVRHVNNVVRRVLACSSLIPQREDQDHNSQPRPTAKLTQHDELIVSMVLKALSLSRPPCNGPTLAYLSIDPLLLRMAAQAHISWQRRPIETTKTIEKGKHTTCPPSPPLETDRVLSNRPMLQCCISRLSLCSSYDATPKKNVIHLR